MGDQGTVTVEYNTTPGSVNAKNASKTELDNQKVIAQQFGALKSAISGQFETMFKSSESKAHQKGLEILNNLAYQYMCSAFFVEMAWTPEIGEVVDSITFSRRYNLRQEFKLLLLTVFERLETGGILEKIAVKPQPKWRVIKSAPSKDDIEKKIKDLQTEMVQYPECHQETLFANHVGQYIYAVMTGKENGLTVLFPSENSPNFESGAKRFYERSMTMKYYKLFPTIEGIINHVQFLLNNGLSSIGRPVQILEIGGGTGGTTIPLMRALTKLRLPVEYTFSDISNFFVSKTKAVISEEFPAIPVYFKTIDIERPLLEQGIEPGTYDIVLAADVYHATEYLDDTLIHTRTALKDGGLLVLGEVFESTTFLEISFGFAGGWWRWGDEFRTHNCPLLKTDEWDALLRQTGFAESFSVGHKVYGVVFARADTPANV